MKGEWRVSTRLKEIVQQIPSFIQEVKGSEGNLEKFYGRYHLGQFYELSNWPQSISFASEEQDEADPQMFYTRVAVVTETCFLLFEPKPEHENESTKQGLLLAWATLVSIEKIQRF